MKKLAFIIVGAAALVAAPALAQRGPGGGNGGGGGMGGGAMGGSGMGSGPPMSPPGWGGGTDASTRAGTIADQRGAFGRTFAEQQRMNSAAYREAAVQHRTEAQRLAEMARSGQPLGRGADGRIRDALKADIDAWRDEFGVGRNQWQAERDRWIVDRKNLTPAQWAERRSQWFATRDAWIARNRAYAQTRP